MDYAELNELKKIGEERKMTPEKLLEEKVAPFQNKISKSQGELIGALTRDYHQLGCGCHQGGINYSLIETLYTGFILPETKFSFSGDKFILGEFLSEIGKPYSLELNSNREKEFREVEDKSFGSFGGISPLELIYFMDKSPQVPEDSYYHTGGCFGWMVSTVFQTFKPRLELYIGNKETISFLQENLNGWRYTKLSKLFDYDLPITKEISDKIKKEQFEIFDKVRSIENKISNLTQKRDKRLEAIKESGGEAAFFDGVCIELTDEFVENMKYNPLINDSKREWNGLIQTAIKRNYHEDGINFEKEIESGIVMKVDFKEFFLKRKETLKL